MIHTRSHRSNRSFVSLPTLSLALGLAVASCAEPETGPAPLSEEALNAVTDNAGAPKRDLARQVDDVFAKDSDFGETRALLVMANGKIAAERYGEGYDASTPMVSWSMAKTITAVMIGMLVADGRLRLDESAPVALWQRPGDPRGEITLRQLLQMRSGLRHTEAGDPPYESSEVRMLFLDGRDDMAKWAEEQPLEAEPGAMFEYSSNTTVILADIAARTLTQSDDPNVRAKVIRDYLQARLFYQIWLNRERPESQREYPHPLFPDRAPQSVFSLIGHMGQYVIASPEQRVTLVRLGHSNSQQREAMMGELADILELYPVR